MKQILSLLLICIATTVLAQEKKLNDYKYVIVDNQYEFQKEANEYQFNELAVFELKKRNFKAYRNSQVLPEDLNRGVCNALNLKMEKSGMLGVNLVLTFENCAGQVVFTAIKGRSTIKDYQKAYFAALREAMTSLDDVDYAYEPDRFIKKVRNSEGLDSVPTQMGQPGIKKDAPIASQPTKPIEAEKTVAMEQPSKAEEQVDVAARMAMEQQMALVKKDYVSTDSTYSMIPSTEGFTVFKGDALIGTLKKSKGGCYLAITTKFVGIGYEVSEEIHIEHTTNSLTQIIVFEKA